MLFSLAAVSALLGIASASPIVERVTAAGFQDPRLQARAAQSQFLNNKTQPFWVNGTALPDVDFDIGESYAGLLPISGAPNETRELFFWFFPSTNPNATEEIGVWFNGGPGCSSLSGLLTENGPFLWQSGTLAPTPNPYSWVNLTNMMWIEQPVGVGYTQGTPNITNEVELAAEFLGFYKQFVDLFDLHGWDVYLTGESYGGYYVPYIANAFVQANDSDYYNLQGIAINDPLIGNTAVQQDVIIPSFVDYWQNFFYLNDTFRQDLQTASEECGYPDYLSQYFTFPPQNGTFPLPNQTCDMFDYAVNAITEINPCFDIYHISDTCPFPWSVLGGVNPGDYIAPNSTVYFNRTDVQEALHAVVGTDWQQCTSKNVFGLAADNQSLSDTSSPPANNGVLANVIEATNNVLIGSGDLDMLLSTNGTLLSIQNMTWNGCQGLDEYPTTPFYVPPHPEYNQGALAGSGYLGTWTESRGLTFYTVRLAGHEVPEYAPGAAYRMLELLLGRIDSLSQVSDFTTQQGNYTGNSTIYIGPGATAEKLQ